MDESIECNLLSSKPGCIQLSYAKSCVMVTKETNGRPVNKLEHNDEDGSLEEESKTMESFLANKSTKETHHIHTLKWGMAAADVSQQQLTVPEVLDLDVT